MAELVSLKTKIAIGLGVSLAVGAAFLAMGFDLSRKGARVSKLIAEVPLTMWSATALDAEGKAIKETRVCADPMIRQGFEMPLPSFNGAPCLMVEAPVLREGRVDARCKVGAESFVVNISRAGDPGSDFTVRMRTQPLALRDAGAVQTIRYRHLGPCPTAWRAGQAVDPVTGRTYDALAGGA